MKTKILCLFIFSIVSLEAFSFMPRRRCFEPRTREKLLVWGGHGAFYAGSFVPLYGVWYKGYNHTSFHFFNDGPEWKGMDKLGHAWTGFHLASFSNQSLHWLYPQGSCSTWEIRRRKAIFSAAYAMTYLTTLEVFDGFSSGWGFSGRDMAANTAGVGLFALQQFFFRKNFLYPKFSYHATHYPNYRPELLGSASAERVLKDYNGQTYWLSIGVPARYSYNKKWRFLQLSVGYNAEGMTGGRDNPGVNAKGQIIPPSDRRSALFLSFDVDWQNLPIKAFRPYPVPNFFRRQPEKYRWLRILCAALNCVKLPFPALEFRQGNQPVVRWLYF